MVKKLEKRLTSITDYVNIITKREPIKLHVPDERFIIPTDFEMDERHLAWMLDEKERDVLSDRQWLD